MKKLAVLRLLIVFLGIVSLAMLFPFALAIMLGETAMIGVFGLCIACPLAVSLPVFFFTRKTQKEFNAQEGILLVFLGWALACFLGAMPYWGSGFVPRFADAVFESVSGFTTTGASIIPDVEILPRSLNLWRAMTHWLGGMGIIVLTVALLPLLGVGGFQLLKAETTGPEKEKFTPKVTATAKILWLIYLGLTALLAILLALGGMSWFDAVVHAFSTIATGGFSSYNNSIAHFRSAYTDWVCVFFMLLAGLNFTLIYRLLQGRFREAVRNSEARAYLLIVLAAGLIIALSLFPRNARLKNPSATPFFTAFPS
jgi:trk system potassium uptake protein TrkH